MSRYIKSTRNGIILPWSNNLDSLDYTVECDKDGKELYVPEPENEIKARTFDKPIELAPEEVPEQEEEAPEAPAEAEEVPEEEDGLEDLSYPEVQAIVKDLELNIDARAAKLSLIKAIRAAREEGK